jgi:flavin-dependent dehydrogenase
MTKCNVIGAGVNGLILARELSKLDIPTTVYERKKGIEPSKSSSGILSVSGLKSLGINVKNIWLNKLYGANIYFEKSVLHIKSKELQAYGIDREKLNIQLREEAESNGAKILYGKSISKSELSNMDGIIAGADGAVSNVASYFGFPSIKRFVLTYRAEYKAKKEDMETVDLFFDNNITKGLFGWVAPHGDDIEIGVGIESKLGKSTDAFKKFIMKKEVKDLIKDARFIGGGASIIPIALRKRFAYDVKNVLLVGDAAGQVKSTTGGGIIFGGNAAIIAAKAIHDKINSGISLEAYERNWLREFGMEVRFHNLIHSIYSSLSNRQLDYLARFLKALSIEKVLSKYGDMDRPSLIIKRMFRV